jgi:hypothetical protein
MAAGHFSESDSSGAETVVIMQWSRMILFRAPYLASTLNLGLSLSPSSRCLDLAVLFGLERRIEGVLCVSS